MKTKILMALLLAIFAASTIQAKKLLVVGAEWAPFEFKESKAKNAKVIGIDIDIATHIFNKMGIEAEFKILPWKRAWGMIEKGQADAVVSTSRKDKRKPFLHYPKEDMWVSTYVLFVKKGREQELNNVKNFEVAKANNLKIGVVKGYSYNSALWQTFPYKDGTTSYDPDKTKYHSLMEGANSDVLNFKKLGKGRIDVFPSDLTVGRYMLAQANLSDQVGWLEKPMFQKGYPMPFAKKSSYPNIKQVADQFEKELIALKKSGKYDKIRDKWFK